MRRTSSLDTTIQTLARQFAEGILEALQGASLSEILGDAKGASRAGRPAERLRPSARARGGDAVQTAIGAVLRKAPNGLRAEELRAALGVTKSAFTVAIRAALKSGAVRKTGERRGTKYFPR